jgi:hypothetical protein
MAAALPLNIFNVFAQAAECGQNLNHRKITPYNRPFWFVVRCFVLVFSVFDHLAAGITLVN